MSYETRTLDKDEALAFVQNMQWFADRGRIKCVGLKNGKWRVTASKTAWSWWC